MNNRTETVLFAFVLAFLSLSIAFIGYAGAEDTKQCQHHFSYSTCAYALNR